VANRLQEGEQSALAQRSLEEKVKKRESLNGGAKKAETEGCDRYAFVDDRGGLRAAYWDNMKKRLRKKCFVKKKGPFFRKSPP